jgi:hypothetical protein
MKALLLASRVALLLGSFALPPELLSSPLEPRSGLPATIDPSVPPESAQLIQLFLENAHQPSANTSCDNSPDAKRRTLREELSMLLGYGVKMSSRHYLSMRTICEPGQAQRPDGSLVEVWVCSFHVETTDARRRPQQGGLIMGSFTRSGWELLPHTLHCS